MSQPLLTGPCHTCGGPSPGAVRHQTSTRPDPTRPACATPHRSTDMEKLTTFFKDVDTKIKSKLNSSFGSCDEVSSPVCSSRPHRASSDTLDHISRRPLGRLDGWCFQLGVAGWSAGPYRRHGVSDVCSVCGVCLTEADESVTVRLRHLVRPRSAGPTAVGRSV